MMRKEYAFDDLPDSGDAFHFKVSSELYGVCRIIRRCTTEEMARHGCPTVLCAVSAWHGKDVPDQSDASLREIGTCTVTSGEKKREELRLLWIDTPPPPECAYFGKITPTAAEAEIQCFAFAAWQSLFWAGHQGTADSAVGLSEDLSRLAYSKVIDDAKLRHWRGAVPENAADEVRDSLRRAIQKVADLQGQDRRDTATATVQECVRELNRVDEKHGPFICTIEREDLCNILCSLLELAGVDSPDDIIDEQRDW